MRQVLAVAIAALFLTSPAWAEGSQPIQGKVTLWVNGLASKTTTAQIQDKSKSVLNSILGWLDTSGNLQTDQVAMSVSQFVLAQPVPKTSILILAPQTDNKATEQFQGYLSAILLHAGFAIGQPSAVDLPQSRIVPFSLYPQDNGVIVSLKVNDTQMSRFYALQESGKIEFASAFMVRKLGGN